VGENVVGGVQDVLQQDLVGPWV